MGQRQPLSPKALEYDLNQVRKALVMLSIEKSLLNIGKPIYDKVVELLDKEYHCYLGDCYEHPEYLNAILRELFGNSSNVIVESIKEQLGEFSYANSVAIFLEAISQ